MVCSVATTKMGCSLLFEDSEVSDESSNFGADAQLARSSDIVSKHLVRVVFL